MDKKGQIISSCYGYLDAIHYFVDIRLHNEFDNSTLKELCKKDLESLRSGKISTRPHNIQDELVLGRIYEANENELLKLFEKKFEKAKNHDGFKTKKSFAKHEYKYQKGIWKNNDITKWIPIAKQWLNLLKGIATAGAKKVAHEKYEELKDFFKTGTNVELIEERNLTTSEHEIKHPIHDPNKFNSQGYKFFKYLIENYYYEDNTKPTPTKLINIWHYFNNSLNSKQKYSMRMTKETYKDFIIKNYNIKISNDEKKTSYNSKHLPKLKGHFLCFEENN